MSIEKLESHLKELGVKIISKDDIRPIEPLADEDQNWPVRDEPEYLPDGVTIEECREAMEKIKNG
jgi:hypothetical protein